MPEVILQLGICCCQVRSQGLQLCIALCQFLLQRMDLDMLLGICGNGTYVTYQYPITSCQTNIYIAKICSKKSNEPRKSGKSTCFRSQEGFGYGCGSIHSSYTSVDINIAGIHGCGFPAAIWYTLVQLKPFSHGLWDYKNRHPVDSLTPHYNNF